jgi:hypothetical protein
MDEPRDTRLRSEENAAKTMPDALRAGARAVNRLEVWEISAAREKR